MSGAGVCRSSPASRWSLSACGSAAESQRRRSSGASSASRQKRARPSAKYFDCTGADCWSGGGVRLGPDVLYSLTAVFSLSYLTTMLGQSRTLALIALSLGGACNAIAIPFFGALSDRFGRRAVYGVGAALGVDLDLRIFPVAQHAVGACRSCARWLAR